MIKISGILKKFFDTPCKGVAPDPTPPVRVINFQVTDACNSRCVMCNIWRQRGANVMSVDRLTTILQQPFFKHVEHVGFSGGEPGLAGTLRAHYEAAAACLPHLKGLSVISNAILPDATVNLGLELKAFAEERGLHYSVMLSLDGVGDVHDNNRGTKGNFASFCRVANTLKSREILFTTGTTITSHNVWGLDELLFYLKKNEIKGFFRIAEYINRLDNADCTTAVRNFSDEEKYQLQLFFHNLIYSYENSPKVKNTYYSIMNILRGGKSLISCPYKKGEAVTIDSYGYISCCAPKDNNFLQLPDDNLDEIYRKHFNGDFSDITSKFCDNCIHDYHDDPLPELTIEKETTQKWASFISVDSFFASNPPVNFNTDSSPPINPYIFIVGWYGTETVGDKAILKSIVSRYNDLYPNHKIRISSLFPFVTEQTINELDIEAEVIPVYSELFFQSSASADIVVVGGGPLMELEELSLILWAFYYASENKKQCHIYGCGIGPLYSEEKKSAIAKILDYADVISLRDKASLDYIRDELGKNVDANIIGDPALAYIKTLKRNIDSKDAVLACFLRDLTFEYRSDMDYEKFSVFKDKFEQGLAENIKTLCDAYNLRLHLYSMHNFIVGNDDRYFNYYFADKFLSNLSPYVENKLSTVNSIAFAMQKSKLNICMRFHSVVFANTLETNYLAIDYTSGGKIFAFMNESDRMERLVTMRDCVLSGDVFVNRLENYSLYR